MLAEETDSEQQSSTTVTVQTDLSAHDINNMESKLQEMHTSLYKSLKTPANCCFDVNEFVNDNDRVKYYTGLPNFKVLELLFEFLHKHVPCGNVTNIHLGLRLVIVAMLLLKLKVMTCETAIAANYVVHHIITPKIIWAFNFDHTFATALA